MINEQMISKVQEMFGVKVEFGVIADEELSDYAKKLLKEFGLDDESADSAEDAQTDRPMAD